jgi:hypothetical protein
MMSKKFFVAALALLALTSVNALRANAQSCPIGETFGARHNLAVNKNLQSQIEITYFTTDDPNAFLSERAGINRSASYVKLSTNQFVAKLQGLEREGVASVRKQQSTTSFLGELAQLNLESSVVNAKAGRVNARFATLNHADAQGLDRSTEVKVYEGGASEGGYYRVSLLSWFVDASASGNRKMLDYDAIVLLKPGQTAVFKLVSNYEVKRSGAKRTYMAVTMRSVNNVGMASLGSRR